MECVRRKSGSANSKLPLKRFGGVLRHHWKDLRQREAVLQTGRQATGVNLALLVQLQMQARIERHQLSGVECVCMADTGRKYKL